MQSNVSAALSAAQVHSQGNLFGAASDHDNNNDDDDDRIGSLFRTQLGIDLGADTTTEQFASLVRLTDEQS